MPHVGPYPTLPHPFKSQVGRYIQMRGGTVAAEELAPLLDLKPGQLAADRGRIAGGARQPGPAQITFAAAAGLQRASWRRQLGVPGLPWRDVGPGCKAGGAIMA